MQEEIIIIGSGWLGTPLGLDLVAQGHTVTATTTTEEKLKNTTKELDIVLLNTNDPEQAAQKVAQTGATTMIIAIPPRRGSNNYYESLMVLSALADLVNVKRVLFISSSSVWGENTGVVNEQTNPSPTSDSAIAMVKFEQHLLSHPSFEASVLRLTGLFNQQRHPGRFLAGRLDVANPEAPVNMIHQQDCIGLTSKILQQTQWRPVYIGCAPSHPTRRHFYQHGAKMLELVPPQFAAQGGADGKKIDASASAASLNYTFVYPDIMSALADDTNLGK